MVESCTRRTAIGIAAALAVALAVTPPVAAVDPIVAAVGDIACDPNDANFNSGLGTASACHMLLTAGLASGWVSGKLPSDAAVLLLGDLQYEDGSYAKYQGSFDPSWGSLKPWTRPAPGNHDYVTPGAAGYYQYFGAAAADPAKGWYSYDLGSWHLIALNSNCGEIGGCGPGSPEEAWLEADLAAHSAVCTLAYWHHPRFSSGPHGDDPKTDAFWRVLYRYGADVVLAGHDHVYERFHRQTPWGAIDAEGPKQFTVGTGGKVLTGLASPSANSAVFLASDFGVLRLTLQPSAYAWEFINPSGTVLDSGATACHLRGAPRSASYYTVTPCRLADTRLAVGPSGGPALAAGVPRWFPAAGTCGVPAGAVAVAVNATAVGATADGSLRLYAAGDTVPPTNVVSFRAAGTRAASAVVPLGQLGAIAVLATLPGGASVDAVLDVTGYFVE